MKDFIKANQYIIGFIFTFLIALAPIFWFKGNFIAGEEWYAIDYAKWGKVFSDTWFNRLNYGEFSMLAPFKFQQVFFDILYFVGFSKYLTLVIWTVLTFVLAATTFYYFLYLVFEKKISPFFYFLCTLYYVYGPYFLNISAYLSPPRLLYAVMPSIFILFYLIYKNIGKIYIYLFYINLILLIASPIFVNIPAGLVLLALILMFLIYICLVSKIGPLSSIKIIGWMFLLYILFNTWWLLPTAYKLFGQASVIRTEASTFSTIDKTPTADVLSLFGSWAFREGIYGTDYNYFPFYLRFDKFPGVIFRFVPFIFILLGLYSLILKPRQLKNNTYFILFIFACFFIFMVLSKGVAPPFGGVYKFLYDKFPLFWMFREPYAKFLPFASFASATVLIIGLNFTKTIIQKYLPNKTYILGLLIIFGLTTLAIVFIAFPILSGEVVWKYNDENTRSQLIQIPQGWKNLIANWKPRNGYYYLITSQNSFGTYMWPSGYTGDPYLMLTDANTLNPHKGYAESDNIQRRDVISYILRTILSNPKKFYEECSRYDLAGFIIQNDLSKKEGAYFSDTLNNLRTIYSDIKVFDNESATIFECPVDNLSKIAIYPTGSLVNINPNDIGNYNKFKSVQEKLPLFKVQEGVLSDVSILDPKTDSVNSIKYDISKLSKDSSIYLYRNSSNVSAVTVDGISSDIVQIDDYIKVNLKNNEECCNELEVKLLQSEPSFYSQNNPWFKMDVTDLNFNNAMQIKPSELFLDSKISYLTPLNSFDPLAIQNIVVQHGLAQSLPIGVAIIQKDLSTNLLRFIVNYKAVPEPLKPISIRYDGPMIDPINLFNKSSYYLGFYTFTFNDISQTDAEIIKNMSFNPGIVSVTSFKFPLIIAARNINLLENSTNLADYHELGSSILTFNLKASKKDNPIVHFMNSYHPNWLLIKLNRNDFVTYSKGIPRFFGIVSLLNKVQNGEKPMNIEYYSNGWETTVDTGDNYFAIVFLPALYTRLLFLFSSLAFMVVCVGMIYKFRKRA